MGPLSSTSRRLIRNVSLTMFALETALPVGVIFGYFLISGLWSLRDDLGVVGTYLACLPFLTLFSALMHARFNLQLTRVIEALVAKEPVAPSDLEGARKAVLKAPRRAGISVLVNWCLLHPAVLAFGVRQFGEHQSTWPLAFRAGVIIAPLMATLAMLSFEELIRPAVSLLFADGGIHRFRAARRQTLMRRFLLVGVLWLYSLFLLGYVSYRITTLSTSVTEIQVRLLVLDALCLIAGLVMMSLLAFLARRMLGEPLGHLLEGLQQVHEGNLSVRLPIEVADSFGILAERFNHMVEGLRERMQLQEAFGRYVSPEIAKKAITGPLSLGGETREITVLFVDIRGFTALSETLSAEELVALMNRYFELVVTCIRTHGGHVNKFIGDGLMALFGAPNKSPRHADEALRAAFAIEQALDIFNLQQLANDQAELAIGIGIATGPVVVGNVGSRDRLEYTAMGDTVNLASRIEGLNKELRSTILVGEQTYHRLQETSQLRELGSLFVKGKREAIRVYAPHTSTGAMLPLPVRAET